MIKFNVKKTKSVLVAASALLLACTLNVSAEKYDKASDESIKEFNTLVTNSKSKDNVTNLINSIKNAENESSLYEIAQNLDENLGSSAKKLKPLAEDFIYAKMFTLKIQEFVQQFYTVDDTFNQKAFNKLKNLYNTVNEESTLNSKFAQIFNIEEDSCQLKKDDSEDIYITIQNESKEKINTAQKDIFKILQKIINLLNPILNISNTTDIKTFLDAKLNDLNDNWNSEITVEDLLKSYIDQINTITESLEKDFANKLLNTFHAIQIENKPEINIDETKTSLQSNSKGLFDKIKNISSDV